MIVSSLSHVPNTLDLSPGNLKSCRVKQGLSQGFIEQAIYVSYVW